MTVNGPRDFQNERVMCHYDKSSSRLSVSSAKVIYRVNFIMSAQKKRIFLLRGRHITWRTASSNLVLELPSRSSVTVASRNALFFFYLVMVTHPRPLSFARWKHSPVRIPAKAERKFIFSTEYHVRHWQHCSLSDRHEPEKRAVLKPGAESADRHSGPS